MAYIVNPKDIPDLRFIQCDRGTAMYLLFTAGLPLLGFSRESEKPYLFSLTERLTLALEEYKKYKANQLGKEA